MSRKRQKHTFVPQQLFQNSDSGSAVWIVTAEHRAVRKDVRVGAVEPDGLVEILDGLNATDKLIASGVENLSHGDDVTIRGEDKAIGVGR